MNERESKRPAGARAEDGTTYEGKPGRTHTRSVQVTTPQGLVRSVQIYDVVNVGTDPQLREPALAGALHRFESGETLAIPFTYHDPHKKKLAHVVPEALRHEELSLRARFMTQLAEHPEASLPRYAAEATAVVGIAGLVAYLERAADDELAELSQNVEIQSEALVQRETRLKTRAEEVTRREDELRRWLEELEAGRADLAMQQRELDSRLEVLGQRESDLASRSSATLSLDGVADDVQLVDDVRLVDDVQLVDDMQLVDAVQMEGGHQDDAVQLGDAVLEDAVLEDAVLDDDVEELDDLEPIGTSPRLDPADLASSVELVGEGTSPQLVSADEVQNLADDVAELVEEDAELLDDDLMEEDVEELIDLEPIGDVTGVHSDVDGAPLQAEATNFVKTVDGGPPPSVLPPPGFLEPGAEAMAIAGLEAGAARLFVRLPAGADHLFESKPPELVLQLVRVDERPVALFGVAEAKAGRPTVIRAALDPQRAEGRGIVESLAKRFAARVSFFTSQGAYRGAMDLEGPRAGNAARILERVAKSRSSSPIDFETAASRVLASPPPTRAEGHPFVSVEQIPKPKRAGDAADRLARLVEWSDHAHMDRAQLELGLPRGVIEAATRTILEHAHGHGLPLPPHLFERALSLGLAPDAGALVGAQIEAFTKTTGELARGGLSKEQVASGWERLLELAAEHEIAIDTATHEVAWKAIGAVRGPDSGPQEVDPAKLPELSPPELVQLMSHPRYRRDAALELASRKDAELAEPIAHAVRKMPRPEVVRVAPQLLNIGDGAGDALIDGLSARKTFVRQAFALGLAQLKLRRAVVPLVHLLSSEESDIWPELARVVGSFGTASMRSVSRQLKDPKGRKERFVLTLAHLANHGCEKQVKKLELDGSPSIAAMATEALGMRDKAAETDKQARGTAELAPGDPVLEFSRRFYAELEGRAPEGDLE